MAHDGATTQIGSADPLIGRVLSGRFRVLRLIDQGGMGRVYRAEQLPLGRPVALKVLDKVDKAEEYRQRFLLEATHASRLHHSNTVRVYDYGVSDDGIYYLAMEFLEGQSLEQLLAREAPLDPLRVIHIAQQVCGALEEAHAAGLVHRDLKPGNVFLVRNGDDPDFAKLLDFGLVKDLGHDSGLSRTDMVLGSPHYISPEQVEANPVDGRTDLYSLGVILYVALCGELPFSAKNPLAMMMQHAHKEAPTFAEKRPGLKVPANLEWLVRRMMEKEPESRPASAREVMRGLAACGRELRGGVAPFSLAMEHGVLKIPSGLIEESVATVLAAPRAEPKVAPKPSQSTTRTVVTPMNVALSGLVLAGIAGGALLAVGALGAAWWVWEQPEAPILHAAVTRPVEIRSSPPGADVTRGYATLGKTPLTVHIPLGETWELDVSAAGYALNTLSVGAEAGEVEVTLAPRE